MIWSQFLFCSCQVDAPLSVDSVYAHFQVAQHQGANQFSFHIRIARQRHYRVDHGLCAASI